MNVLEYLQNGGNVIDNPDYNPKTKKGRLQKPTLTTYKPGDNIIDQVLDASVNAASELSYNLTGLDVDKYADYNVYVNPVQTQEELDKERANNQSNWEQLGRAAIQAGTEVGTGIVIGAADIVDALVNIGNEDNDYQNVVSNYFEGLKESVNERFAIYRENPDKAFDVTDWAWWMSNAPTIVSSLSLMVPGMGVTKGLSLLGKGLRLNKIANKIASYRKLTDNARKTIGVMAESATTGAVMRLGENYLEARQTHKDVEDMAFSNLRKMSAEDKATFLENNPKYKGMSDEDIARDIANNSADITFANDWANIFFDIAQVYGTRNVWKNAINGIGTGTSRLRRLNQAAAKYFGDKDTAIKEAIAAKGFVSKAKQSISDFGRDVWAVGRTEWTEGVEEAINYISSQEGLYAGKKVFDNTIDAPTMGDYLKDPHLWEQAFWGVLGGVVFGKAFSSVKEFAGKKLNKEWSSAEQQKEAEILSRSVTTQKYLADIKAISEGKNPYDNNSPIDASQQEEFKELAGKIYIDDLVINAANAGNLRLLESFMNDNNFTKGLREKLGLSNEDSVQLVSQFNESLKVTKNAYNDAMSRANLNGADFNVARIIAGEVVKAQHAADSYDKVYKNKLKIFNDLVGQEHIQQAVGDYIEDAKDGIVLADIMRRRAELDAVTSDNSLSKEEREIRAREISQEITNLEKLRPVKDISEDLVKEKIKAANKLAKEHIDIYNSYVQSASAENHRNISRERALFNDGTIKSKVARYNNFLDKSRKKIVDGAMKDIENMFDKYGSAEVTAYRNNQTNSIEDADKVIIDKAYTVLDLTSESNAELNEIVKAMARNSKLRREKAGEKSAQEIQEVIDNTNLEIVEGSEDEEVDSEEPIGSPLTGGVEQTGATQTEEPPITPPKTPIVQSPPPVEDGEQPAPPAQPETPATPKINIPDDQDEQFALADQIVYEYLADVNLDDNSQEHVQSVREGVKQRLVSLGFAEEVADASSYNIVDAVLGGSSEFLESSIRVRDDKNISRPILKYAITHDVSKLKLAIENFINTEINGQTYGRRYNGKVYFSLSDFMNYVYNTTRDKYIAAVAFNELRNYLFSDQNKDYVVVDDASIQSIDAYQISGYLQQYNDMRRNKIVDLRNEVNIDWVFGQTYSGNTDGVMTIRGLKKGQQLKPVYNDQSKRIELYDKDGKNIGYLGTADIVDGVYYKTNEYWRYDISIDNKGQVHSKLMGWINSIFNEDVNLDLQDEINKINDKSISDEIRNELARELTIKLIRDYGAGPYVQLEPEYFDEQAAVAGKHLAKILKRAVGLRSNYENNLKTWFDHLAGSYLAAEELVNSKKPVVIDTIWPGILNTEQTRDYEGTYFDEGIENYKEDVNQLGVIHEGKVTFSRSVTSEYVSGLPPSSNLIVKIARPDGTNAYALCKQVPISSVYNKNTAINEIVTGVNVEVQKIVKEFVKNANVNSVKALDDAEAKLNKLFGVKGLIKDIKVVRHSKGLSIILNKGTNPFANKQNWLFNLNIPGRAKGKDQPANVFIYINGLANGKDAKYYTSSNVDKVGNADLNKLMESIIKESTFGVPIDWINDAVVSDKKNNPYVYRENGKTIIAVGNMRQEYNSYQDFLVKNKLIKSKIKNDKTPNIIGDEQVAIGNFVYTPETTGIKIRIPGRKARAKVYDPVVRELKSDYDIFDTEIISSDIPFMANAFVPENFGKEGALEYFINRLASRTGLDGQLVIDYYNELVSTGLITNEIELSHNVKENVFAAWDTKNKKIIIAVNKILEQADKGRPTSVARLMNIIVHENIHAKVQEDNLSARVTEEFEPIYKEFRRWYDRQNAEVKDKWYDFTQHKHLKADGVTLTAEGYEEFMVECLTSGKFMELLNNIKTDEVIEQKPKTLFGKIMEVIAKLFNIAINPDSLLAKARLASMKVLGENIENGAEVTNQNAAKPKTTTNALKNRFRHSSIPTTRNIENSKADLSLSEQVRFDDLIGLGEIGFACM